MFCSRCGWHCHIYIWSMIDWLIDWLIDWYGLQLWLLSAFTFFVIFDWINLIGIPRKYPYHHYLVFLSIMFVVIFDWINLIGIPRKYLYHHYLVFLSLCSLWSLLSYYPLYTDNKKQSFWICTILLNMVSWDIEIEPAALRKHGRNKDTGHKKSSCHCQP